MAGRVSKVRPAAVDLVFQWRGLRDSAFPKVAAFLVVSAIFAFFLTMVRVRVTPPVQPEGKKAAVVYLSGPVGREWALRAEEGGPFPSRYEPDQWVGMADLEKAGMAAAQVKLPAHVSQLVDLPEAPAAATMPLADKAQQFFPKRAGTGAAMPDFTKLRLVPTLYPLAGVKMAEIPEKLPPFTQVIDGTMSSTPWRFLIRLHPSGGVEECVSLEGGSAKGSGLLEKWLYGVAFQPSADGKPRWISVAVVFTNQSANGPVAR